MNFRTLDLNLLRVFEAILLEGNVTRAAERLAMTQPGVSNALARLRSAVQDDLFEKTTDGVQPTARARELWNEIKPHYEGLRGALTPSGVDPREFDAQVRIAMSDYTVQRVMPRLSAFLGQEAPHLRIGLFTFSAADLPFMFERQGVDLALGSYLSDSAPRAGLRTRSLWVFNFALLMRAGHPLSQQELTLEKFLGARHIDVIAPGMHAPGYDQMLAGQGLKRNLVLTLNGWEQALSIISASDCVGVLPRDLLDGSPYAHSLVAVEAPIPVAPRDLWIIWHRRHESSALHSWLRAAIMSMFAGANASELQG